MPAFRTTFCLYTYLHGVFTDTISLRVSFRKGSIMLRASIAGKRKHYLQLVKSIGGIDFWSQSISLRVCCAVWLWAVCVVSVVRWHRYCVLVYCVVSLINICLCGVDPVNFASARPENRQVRMLQSSLHDISIYYHVRKRMDICFAYARRRRCVYYVKKRQIASTRT